MSTIQDRQCSVGDYLYSLSLSPGTNTITIRVTSKTTLFNMRQELPISTIQNAHKKTMPDLLPFLIKRGIFPKNTFPSG